MARQHDGNMFTESTSTSTTGSVSLLSLPNELLFQIAQYIDDNHRSIELFDLSLVCRQLSMIVYGTILSPNGAFAPRHTWALTQALLNDREAANKITTLQLNAID